MKFMESLWSVFLVSCDGLLGEVWFMLVPYDHLLAFIKRRMNHLPTSNRVECLKHLGPLDTRRIIMKNKLAIPCVYNQDRCQLRYIDLVYLF